KKGISYRTAWRWFKQGLIKGYQMPTGTIIVEEEPRKETQEVRCVIYARVSDKRSKDLEKQIQRLMDYATAKGYKIVKVVKEIGSGVNDKRPKLIEILQSDDYEVLLVEHKDRLTRFGFNYLKVLLEKRGITIEVVNPSQDDKEDLLKDFVSIIYSFSARLYGLRRGREVAKRLKEFLLDI
ncbi:MAG: IS607 family transposase, partial [Sulfurihydrogenibium sp.]